MIELKTDGNIFVIDGTVIAEEAGFSADAVNLKLKEKGLGPLPAEALPGGKIDITGARNSTMAARILKAHNSGKGDVFQLRFDALASHDITYVNIIQTALACGLTEFPLPYVLTNCHNSLCAVGGTINEDDHMFGLSAARKFGGIYVPPHLAVIHQYMREKMCRVGSMILGSDSHTRYGALGVMGIGEGGPELVKQLLQETYDVKPPKILGVYLDGKPAPGVGPQDVALAIIGAVFKKKIATNKVLEFTGPGIGNLSVDFRNGIDVMTTETTALSSIWPADDKVRQYYKTHGIENSFSELRPGRVACYDGIIVVHLDKVEPMIAFPFHPANVYPISAVKKDTAAVVAEVDEYNKDLMKSLNISFAISEKMQGGKLIAEQGVVAGCAGGTFENIVSVAHILEANSTPIPDFSLYVYPASQPINMEIIRNKSLEKIIRAGGVIRSAFCGPCFGACDSPSHRGLSFRHTTRNFPNREGSKPEQGQISAVFLMDARSIAATAVRNGELSSAFDVDVPELTEEYRFDESIYQKRVYTGFEAGHGKPQPSVELHFGPDIRPWPVKPALPEHLFLVVASSINDPVTTTDELIPSGETSSYRSNPEKLSGFFLSKRDPQFQQRAAQVREMEEQRKKYAGGKTPMPELIERFFKSLGDRAGLKATNEEIVRTMLSGNAIFAQKPGDGSAREQAASCQKILDVWANIARDYATKRYRSNLINWGVLPFILSPEFEVPGVGDMIFVPGVRDALVKKQAEIKAYLLRTNGNMETIHLDLPQLGDSEQVILLEGNVINSYRNRKK